MLSKLKNGLKWLDEHLLLIMAAFLLAFIPLYPKIPLWSPIEQYIVRVRMEDIFILLTSVVWLIQVIRRKVRWFSPMFIGVIAYAIVGLASSLNAMYVIETVPLAPLHIGKTVLHYFRYLEYFSLFFILFSAVKTRKHVKLMLGIIAATVLVIAIYGYGQKFYFWPVYSTMNREFSKGMRLYLTEFARVQSTFAGHYDMAAYLVVFLPVLLALAYRTKTMIHRYGLYLAFWLGMWLLVLSASRAPFGASLVGIGLVVLLSGLVKKQWATKATFVIKKSVITGLLLLVILYYFGTDLLIRVGQLINDSPQFKQTAIVFNAGRKILLPDVVLDALPTPTELIASLPRAKQPPSQSLSTNDLAALIDQAQKEVDATKDVASEKDQPPVAVPTQPSSKPTPPPIFKDTQPKPADVHEEIPDIVEVSTISATGEKKTIKVQRKRVYSDCALKKELSLCIRLETLWPRAIEGFINSPILGQGYATLTKENIETFTEADSTDNNFLRTLGETGLLGFITFYGCILIILYYAFKNITSKDNILSALSIGIIGGTIGLLLNAIYIDVFAASKVAQSYWALTGLFMGYVWLYKNEKKALPAHNNASALAQALETKSTMARSSDKPKSNSQATKKSKRKSRKRS
jgi:hypothetical protein